MKKKLHALADQLLNTMKKGPEALEIDFQHYEQKKAKPPKKEVPSPKEAQPPKEEQRMGEKEDKERRFLLDKVDSKIVVCGKCALSKGRTHAVPGEGVMNPLVLVVGEAPGAEEDRQGRPFVGKAGEQLDKWLTAIQLSRKKNVFITNVVKCRPSNNRDPEEEECHRCNQYLQAQIRILKPKRILCLGRIASRYLSQKNLSMASLRREHLHYDGIPLFATYHPSAVLRNPDYRRPVWIDLQKLQKALHDCVGQY